MTTIWKINTIYRFKNYCKIMQGQEGGKNWVEITPKEEKTRNNNNLKN